ncbi:hypothetical protein GCM10020358_46040 [Amorphoplanes nipponensis]
MTCRLSLSLLPPTEAVIVTVIRLVSPGARLPAVSLVVNGCGGPTGISRSKLHPGLHLRSPALISTVTLLLPTLVLLIR